MTNVGKNISYEIKGSKLIVTMDTAQNFGKSASGKTEIIATTSGNIAIPVDGKVVHLGVNAYSK